uniref:Trichohyalin-like n=1 Tax=Caenorhabditis tropicalis TaxID=1561998 RepID=A0A1I7TF47_9PELO
MSSSSATTFSDSSDLKKQWYDEKKEAENLNETLQFWMKIRRMMSVEDEEKRALIEELNGLKGAESSEDTKDSIYCLEERIHRIIHEFQKESRRNEWNLGDHLGEIHGLRGHLEAVEEDVKELQEDLMGMEKKGSWETIQLKMQLKQVETVNEDLKKQLEELQENCALLEELCEEHFLPKEKERNEAQMRENTEALERIFMDMNIS